MASTTDKDVCVTSMVVVKQLFRPFDERPNALRFRRHPLFRLLGIRGTIAQHTEAEEHWLTRYATGCRAIVEIGVAEGASALALREAAAPDGTIYLVDPYPAGRVPGVSFTKLCALQHLRHSKNANVQFIEDFSYNASKIWIAPIDFLFIDGEHSYDACLRDWLEWSPFVVPGGHVAFHDARVFSNGWPREDWGPVRVVNELFRDRRLSSWEVVAEMDSVVIVRRTSEIGTGTA
jgi:predicted O-methyltransferase YrrM